MSSVASTCKGGRGTVLGLLDADSEALSLGWTLSDEVGPAGMRLEQVVRLLPFHVASKPGVGKSEL